MTHRAIIEKTIRVMSQLPQDKAQEICDFAEFIESKSENKLLGENLHVYASKSASFEFLENEEDLYDLSDIKENRNG
jgi:hypothetical protein